MSLFRRHAGLMASRVARRQWRLPPAACVVLACAVVPPLSARGSRLHIGEMWPDKAQADVDSGSSLRHGNDSADLIDHPLFMSDVLDALLGIDDSPPLLSNEWDGDGNAFDKGALPSVVNDLPEFPCNGSCRRLCDHTGEAAVTPAFREVPKSMPSRKSAPKPRKRKRARQPEETSADGAPPEAPDGIDWPGVMRKAHVEVSPRSASSARFPIDAVLKSYFEIALEGALRTADCPEFRRSEVAYEVEPPPEARPGFMFNATLPFHGFMPVILPLSWKGGATPVQYEVKSPNISRELTHLQKRRYMDKLTARMVATASYAEPMTRPGAQLCYSLVHRLLWLDLVQAELQRLPREGCPFMYLTFDVQNLAESKWGAVDLVGAFKRYVQALPDFSANICARLAGHVASQLGNRRQRSLVLMHLQIFLMGFLTQSSETFPECDVSFTHGSLVGPPAQPKVEVGAFYRRSMWQNGCPDIQLQSAVLAEVPRRSKPGATVYARSPDGNVSLIVPAALDPAKPLWALYHVPRVHLENVVLIVLIYGHTLAAERRRLAEFGVGMDPKLCFETLSQALEEVLVC
mmetsp:Transcript_114966/g.332195  ORF Transcript_114966/g.332195 Transcript_114966/m.332195 type:complete len:575 (-) Transcript_114966:112-1836(-)